MTAAPPERPPSQPQSKALPTVQPSHPEDITTKAAPESRAVPIVKASRPRQDAAVVDFTSRAATIALIRRSLTLDTTQNPDLRSQPVPIEDILPPLTSSNEIDLQLYAIIAIVIKDFVSTWYSKITQDQTFVDEVIQIIAHCSRALEQRIRRVDVPELILDELPQVLERHVIAYRTAKSSPAHQSYGVALTETYHTLNPHPALEPVPSANSPDSTSAQAQNEAAYRQLLVTGALSVLLPTEDVQNTPLRILVSDIIADLIIGQALAGKVCEGWFIHDAIAKAIAASKSPIKLEAMNNEKHQKIKPRLEKFGLLNTENDRKASLPLRRGSHSAPLFWRIMQWMYLIINAIRFTVQGIFHARHLPKRSRLQSTSSSNNGSVKSSSSTVVASGYDQSPRPVLAYSAPNCFSTLVRLDDRMPWFGSFGIFCQHVLIHGSGWLGATNSTIDRFLHSTLMTYIFTPNTVTSVLLGLRLAVFPNNSLGPPAPPPPSPSERIELRRRTAQAIISLIPSVVLQRYFDSVEEDYVVQQIEEDVLGVFDDKYINKHLVYAVLETILVKLVPELHEYGVGELLEMRGLDIGETNMDAAEEEFNSTNIIEKKAEVVTGVQTKK